VPPL
jgi:hypothetical protein